MSCEPEPQGVIVRRVACSAQVRCVEDGYIVFTESKDGRVPARINVAKEFEEAVKHVLTGLHDVPPGLSLKVTIRLLEPGEHEE